MFIARRRSPRAGSAPLPAPLGLALLLLSCAHAQTSLLDGLNPLRADSAGIHLYSVSVYGAYYSTPRAYSGTVFNSGLSSDEGYGVGASLGWNLLRNGSGISILYSPSYNAFHRYSNLSAFNHVFSLTTHHRRDLSSKWRTDLFLEANARTSTEFLFAPSSTGRLSDTPATFDELANAVVGGRITNDDIAALLNGVAPPDSAAGIAIFGDYYLTAGLQGKVGYAVTPRLTVSTSLGGRRFQTLPRSGEDRSASHLLPHSTVATGSVDLSYARSPRTSITLAASVAKPFSALTDSFTTSATLGFGRVMSRRWFMQARAGAGDIVSGTRNGLGVRAHHVTVVGGLGGGYKAESYSVLLLAQRSISDPYGLGARATMSASAGGSWRPHGSSWALLGNAGWQRYEGYGASRMGESWNGRIALDRVLTRQTGLKVAYAFLSNAGAVAAGLTDRSLSGLMVSVYWLPGGRGPSRASP
jgi:hypothetical protein